MAVNFSTTITLGNLLSAVLIITTVVGAYFKLDARVTILEDDVEDCERIIYNLENRK